LPGSGKSYLLNNLKINNSKILTEENFYKECRNISLTKKIISSLICFCKFCDIILLLSIYSITRFGKQKKYLTKTKEFTKYITLYSIIIKKFNNIDLLIWDQGLVQFLWSYTFYEEKKFSSKILTYCIKRCIDTFKIQIIYYKVSPELAAKRATTRQKKCELDYFELDKLIKLYKIHSTDIKLMIKGKNKNVIKFVSNQEEFDEIFKSKLLNNKYNILP